MSATEKGQQILSTLSYGFLGLSTAGTLVLPDEYRPYFGLTTTAALLSGWAAGHIKISGLASLAIYTLILRETYRATDSTTKHGLILAAVLMNLGFSLHKIPGFHNKSIMLNERLSEDAIPFTLYWNFDKIMAGIIPLLLSPSLSKANCAPVSKESISTTALAGVATIAISTLLAIDLGLIRLNPGFKKHFPTWALTNLIGVVPAEEITFRLLIQSHLESITGSNPGLFLSSLLFGAAHYPAGKAYTAIAASAGLGYGYAFQKGGLNAAVLLHFALNLTHFLGFTYPMLKPSIPTSPPVIGKICNFFRKAITDLPWQEIIFENNRKYLPGSRGAIC